MQQGGHQANRGCGIERLPQHARQKRQGRRVPNRLFGQEQERLPQPRQAGLQGIHRRVLLRASHRPRLGGRIQRGPRRLDRGLVWRSAVADAERRGGASRGGILVLERLDGRGLLRGTEPPRVGRGGRGEQGVARVCRQARREACGKQQQLLHPQRPKRSPRHFALRQGCAQRQPAKALRRQAGKGVPVWVPQRQLLPEVSQGDEGAVFGRARGHHQHCGTRRPVRRLRARARRAVARV